MNYLVVFYGKEGLVRSHVQCLILENEKSLIMGPARDIIRIYH